MMPSPRELQSCTFCFNTNTLISEIMGISLVIATSESTPSAADKLLTFRSDCCLRLPSLPPCRGSTHLVVKAYHF